MLDIFVMSLSSHAMCQFGFVFALAALCFLFCILFFLSSFHFIWAPGSGDGVGVSASRSFGPSRNTCPDLPFPVDDFIRKCGAYLYSQRFAELQMNGNSAWCWTLVSGAVAILQWAAGRRYGGTGVATVPLFVAAFCVRSTLRLCAVWRSFTVKRRLRHPLMLRESW